MPKGRTRKESTEIRDKKIARLYTAEGKTVKELSELYSLSFARIRQIVSEHKEGVKLPRHVWKDNLTRLAVGDSYIAKDVTYYTNVYILAKRFGIKVSLRKVEGTKADYEITRIE